MPRCTLDPYEKQRREIRAWIDSGMAMSGIRTYADLARRIGVSAATMSRRYARPETMTMGDMWSLEHIIGRRTA